jgi:1-acyl-sn-glycerol-3-phosphate acyltransferase
MNSFVRPWTGARSHSKREFGTSFGTIGGEIVPHLKVEERLHELADATELSFVVASVPDERKGERPVVLHKLDEASLQSCLERLAKDDMPNLWKPRADAFFRVDGFPQLGSGKLDLQRVKELGPAVRLMNLARAQVPYVFRPPRYAWWFRPILHLLATGFRRHRFKIRRVSVRGDETLVTLVRSGHTVLVTPNHADHADPSLLVQIGRRHRIAFHFMAAREGFESGRLRCFVLQRSGAFSVDREGADLSAIRTAMNILRECRYPLVIFPEGEIYHHHEALDLLNDGVATILLRAAEKLPRGKRAYAIPAAIRIRHDPSVTGTFASRLDRLERRITWKPRPDQDVVERICRLGSALLSIKEEEFMGLSYSGPLQERIERLQEFLVDAIEKRHGKTLGSLAIPSRIKALRQVIRRELMGAFVPLNQRARLEDDLDRLFAAQQLYSYSGRYLSDHPSSDRIAETIFKLEEDVLGAGTYPVAREAEVVFGDPIDVEAFLRRENLDSRSGIRPMTELLRHRIEALMHSACEHPHRAAVDRIRDDTSSRSE